MSIAENIKQVLSELPDGVRLVAVSKFHPNEAIEEAYSAGQRVFGESKVQEMTAKYESLPKDIEWHFIGHLQTNKIKYIVPYVTLIHGVDSYKLLTEINRQAAKAGRTVNCLLQLHIAHKKRPNSVSASTNAGRCLQAMNGKSSAMSGYADLWAWLRIQTIPNKSKLNSVH